MKFFLKGIAFTLLILALPLTAQVPSPATRVRGGAGAPASGACDAAGEVGTLYVRSNAAAIASTLYVCSNTASMTYAWEIVGKVLGAATGTSLVLTGGLTTGSGSGVAGLVGFAQGTACTPGTTEICLYAPASVTSYGVVLPGAVGSTGILHNTTAGSVSTWSYSPIVNADITNATIDLTAKVTGVLPTANIAVALANQTSLRGNAMAAAAGDATIGQVIAHGATALDFASTATGACATVITATATGTASTDVILFNANASIKAVTGYVPAATGGFSISAYPTTNTANFEACNWTSSTVDPGSITVNWKVIR